VGIFKTPVLDLLCSSTGVALIDLNFVFPFQFDPRVVLMGLPSNSRQRGFCSDPRKNRSPAIAHLDPIMTVIKKKRTAPIARPQNRSMVERPLSLALSSPGVSLLV
jgi:hypothetical protein